jgi:arsenate reductase
MGMTLYGITNCDTVKKARAWLEANGVAYAFHDYKKAGIDRALLEQWSREVGWEALVNRSGMTFRKLGPGLTSNLDESKALALLEANPSAIKRPVLSGSARLIVGFKPETYEAALAPTRR